MREIKTAEELHRILLDLGKEFHRICVKHNIPYYMLGGTMLGTVRHKGFIPWDDDMDFGVPREHYKKLKEILNRELSSEYGILTVDNSDVLLVDIIKIQDKQTVINELYKENINEDFGINIDIFPLDIAVSPNSNIKQKILSVLLSIQYYRFLSLKSRPFLKKMVAAVIKFSLFPLNKTTIIKLINKKLITNKGLYIANHYGAWGSRETVPSEVMGNPKLYKFESTQFYGVENAHEYLSSLYGDYMQLPPEGKRHIHITGMYRK